MTIETKLTKSYSITCKLNGQRGCKKDIVEFAAWNALCGKNPETLTITNEHGDSFTYKARRHENGKTFAIFANDNGEYFTITIIVGSARNDTKDTDIVEAAIYQIANRTYRIVGTLEPEPETAEVETAEAETANVEIPAVEFVNGIETTTVTNAADALNIINSLLPNGTFEFVTENYSDDYTVTKRHFSGTNEHGATCYKMIEFVTDGKLQTVRFINTYRDTAIDIIIENFIAGTQDAATDAETETATDTNKFDAELDTEIDDEIFNIAAQINKAAQIEVDCRNVCPNGDMVIEGNVMSKLEGKGRKAQIAYYRYDWTGDGSGETRLTRISEKDAREIAAEWHLAASPMSFEEFMNASNAEYNKIRQMYLNGEFETADEANTNTKTAPAVEETIIETDGSEDDDFADDLPALIPADDSDDDDDELIDEPEIDFAENVFIGQDGTNYIIRAKNINITVEDRKIKINGHVVAKYKTDAGVNAALKYVTDWRNNIANYKTFDINDWNTIFDDFDFTGGNEDKFVYIDDEPSPTDKVITPDEMLAIVDTLDAVNAAAPYGWQLDYDGKGFPVEFNGKVITTLDSLALTKVLPPEQFFDQFNPDVPPKERYLNDLYKELDTLLDFRKFVEDDPDRLSTLSNLIEGVKREILDAELDTEHPPDIEFDEHGEIIPWF